MELDGHYYSTPYQLVGKEVEMHFTSSTVEILYQGKRVASHARSRKGTRHSTLPEHRPKSHQQYLEWTPTRMIDWAGQDRSLYRAPGGGHAGGKAASGDGLSLSAGCHLA